MIFVLMMGQQILSSAGIMTPKKINAHISSTILNVALEKTIFFSRSQNVKRNACNFWWQFSLASLRINGKNVSWNFDYQKKMFFNHICNKFHDCKYCYFWFYVEQFSYFKASSAGTFLFLFCPTSLLLKSSI